MRQRERLWNVKEAAAYLHISAGTLYNWVDDPETYGKADLPFLRAGPRGAIRFWKAELDAWMRRHGNARITRKERTPRKRGAAA